MSFLNGADPDAAATAIEVREGAACERQRTSKPTLPTSQELIITLLGRRKVRIASGGNVIETSITGMPMHIAAFVSEALA